MDFLQRTPFFRLLLGLVGGILSYPLIPIDQFTLYLLILTSFVVLLIGLLSIKSGRLGFRLRWVFGAGVLALFFAFGQLLSGVSETKSVFYPLNEKKLFYAELTSSPVEKPKSYRAEVDLKYYLHENTWKAASGKAVVYFQKSANARNCLIGDKLLLYAQFKLPPRAENPGGFDYKTYLKRNGIGATAYIASDDWKNVGSDTAFSIRRLASQLRLQLLETYRYYQFEGQEFAVLSALTVGYTDELSPDLRASYSASGAMHILSVSGLHVGVIYIVLGFMLGFLRKTKFQLVLKTIFIVLFLWGYAFLTGLSPSVVRASLMFSLVAIGTALERKSQIYNTVFMSAFVMLLINPNYIYNVGFQLSYAAVISIVAFQKPIAGLMPTRNKALVWLRDLFSVSLAAQIGTLPFTLFYFQQFPNYFLLTNLIAIPLSGFIIYASIALLSLSAFPSVAVWIAWLLQKMLFGLNYAITTIFNLPFSTSVVALDFTQSLLLVLCVMLITWYFYSKKFQVLLFSLLSIWLIAIISLKTLIQTKDTQQMIVYAASSGMHISFLDKGKNYFYSTDSVELHKIALANLHLQGIHSSENVEYQPWFLKNYTQFYGSRIAILKPEHWKMKTLAKPLQVDILIIGNKIKPKIKSVLENIKPILIVVDKSISLWYTESIREACSQNRIKFYSVAESGAFVQSIAN